MKIAIILSGIAGKSGTERQALELGRALKGAGHIVHLFCYWHSPEKCYTELIRGMDLSYVRLLEEKDKSSETAPAKSFLPKKIRYAFRVYGMLIKKIFLVEKPLKELKNLIEKKNPLSYYDVLNLHEYEICGISRILSHKNIVCMLNDAGHAICRGKNPIHNFFYNILQKIYNRLALRNVRKFAVLNLGSKKICEESYGITPAVVRSGIDLEMFGKFPSARKFPPETWNIFASSIFSPHRRFEDLVGAAEILARNGVKNISVEINGRHDKHRGYFLFIENLIKEKELGEYIKISGGMSEEELRRKFSETHIFVFPNQNQTWGLAVFEAMLSGAVAIVNREAGASEILKDGENAVLVAPLSPAEIAEKIIFLIKNPEKAEEIAERGQKFVRENLSWNKYAEQMLEVFKN